MSYWKHHKLLVKILISKGSNFGILTYNDEIKQVRELEALGWVKEYDSMFGQTFFVITELGYTKIFPVHYLP